MKTNIVIDTLLPVPCVVTFWFSSYGPMCCQPIKQQHSLKCNMSRKKRMMKFILSMQVNKIFYKLILSFWVCVARHAQSTRNKKFAYICNISRKKSFLKGGSIPLGVPKVPKITSLQNNKYLQYLKQNVKNEVDFLPAYKH